MQSLSRAALQSKRAILSDTASHSARHNSLIILYALFWSAAADIILEVILLQ